MAIVLAAICGPLSAQEYIGAGSVGSQEPLFPYDDQDPWKHGYLQTIPFYGGHHFGRPYNYHHVFAQTQTSVGWGMPHGMPYSQQWWTRFEPMGDPGRAMTEPNGYYGYVAPPGAQPQWAQAAPFMVPTAPLGPTFQYQYPAAPATPVYQEIAPVQYQPAPVPAPPAVRQPGLSGGPMLIVPGVDPRTAQSQSQALRQHLAAPGY